MKQKNLFKIMITLLILCVVVLTGCKDPKPNPGPVSETVTPKTEVHTVVDTRSNVYEVHTANGELVSTHPSLYEAISVCVNDGDTEDYVMKTGDSTKLFINYEKYAEESADMFWYYENGTSLLEYTAWKSSYWQDLAKHGDVVTVFKNSANGTLQYYYNSYAIVNQNSNPEVGAGTTQVWNVCPEIEANVIVDMKAYSGITKSVYTIDLSEAKITPSMSEDTEAWPFIGFITADSYNVSSNGLKCDSSTGNWYYYSGETTHTANSSVVDTDNCYLTSTWDEAAQCYRPDGDVTLTMELLTIVDDEGDEYIVHRLTMDFGGGRTVVKDYEISQLTQCGTIRFTAGLDLESDDDLKDYMCGASFDNLVITSAVATVYEEMLDVDNYGNFAEITEAGNYDILNSNPETVARYHTIVYNPACVDYDFSTAGKDVYNFSYLLDSTAPSLSKHITNVIDAIDALPSVSEVTEADADKVAAARVLVNGLVDTQIRYISNLSKLEELEEVLGQAAIPTLKYTYTDKDNMEAGGEQLKASYDETTGKYTIVQKFITWGKISDLTFNGVVITSENTTISGSAWNGSVYPGGDTKLYQDLTDSDTKTFINSAGTTTYILVYDPQANTLTIEVPVGEGLTYTFTSGSGDVLLNEETGKYECEFEFNQWNRISFKYNGIDITTSNTTIAGAFQDSYPNGLPLLYVDLEGSDNKTFINSTSTATTYHFEYDPETNTLTISVPGSNDGSDDGSENVPTSLTVHSVDSDSDLAIWTNVDKVRTYDVESGNISYLASNQGWRYYVVCDSEGNVVWACYPANSGYGCPVDYHTYYTLASYRSDYTNNPIIATYDGFGPWAEVGSGCQKYDIVVPEGGFVVSAYDDGGLTGLAQLTAMLTKGAVDTTVSEYWISKLNKSDALADGIKLVYDSENQTLSVVIPEAETPTSLTAPLLATNGDSALSVWTEAGTVLVDWSADNKFPTTPNGWRLFIVVTSDNKIAYASINPANSRGTYYCHPDYATENPAVTVTEAGIKVVIPEGGFAITGHTSIQNVLDILTNNTVSLDDGDTVYEPAFNCSTSISADIRVVYDSENNAVVIE